MRPTNTINAFFKAIIDKKAAKIGEFYVQDEETYVVLEGPRLTTLGFANIQKGWLDFCDSNLTMDKIEWLEGPFAEAETKLAWLGGVIKLTVSVGEEKTFEQTFRASFVLKKDAKTNNWLIRHEHISGALADPYGIGDWLKNK